MWGGNDFRRLYGTAQVAGYHGVNPFGSQSLSDATRLFHTAFVEFAVRLSLHDLPHVIYGLTMSDKQQFTVHSSFLIPHFSFLIPHFSFLI